MSPLLLSLRFLQAQPDSRLVALAVEGHTPAFEALVRRYRSELLAYCRRLQPQRELAEDALQQTFLQAWKALSGGAQIRELRPWLYRIAHNVTLNQLRIAVAEPHELEETAREPEVAQLVEQRLQARAALAGLASLPALQREVLVSTTLDGASHQEIASALGLSSGAVRGLIYRARAAMRAAAAAVMPGPVVNWAIRRASTHADIWSRTSGAVAAGSGASVVGAVIKGGAVLSLSAAVAGAGGVIFTHPARHLSRSAGVVGARASVRTRAIGAGSRAVAAASAPSAPLGLAGRLPGLGSAGAADHLARHTRGSGGREDGIGGDGHGGSGGVPGSSGSGGSGGAGPSGTDGGGPSGSDGGSATGSSGSSDDGGSSGGGSSGGSTTTSVASGSSEGGSGGGSDGGSGTTTAVATAVTSGSDGDGPSGGQTLTSSTTSDGGSGSDGGSSGGSDGS